jgi:hypothetical protein
LYEQDFQKSTPFSKKRYDKTTLVSVTLSWRRHNRWADGKRLQRDSGKPLSDKASSKSFRFTPATWLMRKSYKFGKPVERKQKSAR